MLLPDPHWCYTKLYTLDQSGCIFNQNRTIKQLLWRFLLRCKHALSFIPNQLEIWIRSILRSNLAFQQRFLKVSTYERKQSKKNPESLAQTNLASGNQISKIREETCHYRIEKQSCQVQTLYIPC
ncbi:hypothetical protein ACHQM5_020455 [Ranunculus cassubicifolius]